MSILEAFRRDEGRVLDQLVDGELSDVERRELLAGLDDEPGGWRRCALAFLEAQTWRGQMSRLATEPLAAPRVASSAPTSSESSARHSFWGTSLAVAAGLFLAFWLGVKFQSAGPVLQAEYSAPEAGQVEKAQLVESAMPESDVDESEPAADTVAETAAEAGETIMLTLADGEDAEREIHLPVSNAVDGDLAWTESDSTLSTELLQSLQQAGLEVRRQQRLMPITLPDGRRLIVPIEEIEIHDPELAQYH